MKTNNITMPNGVTITSLVLHSMGNNQYLCYAQNRLFIIQDDRNTIVDYDDCGPVYGETYIIEVIVEYCVIPEYDEILYGL